ncbi:MAG TPA: hypothetical protein VMO78_00370 [Rhizomicrobium sp.]|nr:hypothetical protein [Rhizomicrobium sp.]
MRNHVLAAIAVPLLLLCSSAAYCQDASESALGDPAPVAVQDPSLSNSRRFPPSQGTAGVAAVLPARTAGHGANCSATNPCALPTPARDRVTVAQAKSQ